MVASAVTELLPTGALVQTKEKGRKTMFVPPDFKGNAGHGDAGLLVTVPKLTPSFKNSTVTIPLPGSPTEVIRLTGLLDGKVEPLDDYQAHAQTAGQFVVTVMLTTAEVVCKPALSVARAVSA